jgi:hypothetical protein
VAQRRPDTITVGSLLGFLDFISFANVRTSESSIDHVCPDGTAFLTLSPVPNDNVPGNMASI